MENESSNKGLIIGIIIALILIVGFVALTQSDDEPLQDNNDDNISNVEELENTPISDGEYSVDPNQSSVSWQASKRVGGGHNGDVKVQSGEIIVSNGQVVDGQVVIDMTSLTNLDLDGEMSTQLNDHLNSADFFNTEIYKTATLDITNVQADGSSSVATADLTIRGNTETITFPIEVEDQGGQLVVNADLELDREPFEIGTDSTLAEIGLQDTFNVMVTLVASK